MRTDHAAELRRARWRQPNGTHPEVSRLPMSPFALRKNALSRSERRPTTELDLARPKVRHLPLRHTHPKCKRGDVWRSSLTLRVSVSLDRARYILGQVLRLRVLDRGQKPVALRQAARQEHLTCPPNLGSPPFLLKMVSRERHGASRRSFSPTPAASAMPLTQASNTNGGEPQFDWIVRVEEFITIGFRATNVGRRGRWRES